MFDIPAAIESVSNLFTTVVERIWPDPTDVEKAKIERLRMELSVELAAMQAQSDINKIEAANPKVFVSGARPFILWVCGVSLCYVSILEPLARFVATMYGYTGTFPVINTDITLQILLGMLGLAGYRSFEKAKGIARS